MPGGGCAVRACPSFGYVLAARSNSEKKEGGGKEARAAIKLTYAQDSINLGEADAIRLYEMINIYQTL